MSAWILVLTPLPLEEQALTTALARNQVFSRTRHGRLDVTFFPGLRLACAIGGHGKTQFALQAQHLYHQLPGVAGLIAVGAAGGLTPELSPLDVVVAEKTLEHDFHLKFISRPRPEFAGHAPWLERLRSSAPRLRDGLARLHFGIVASGDEDIVTEARAEELHRSTGALAAAWEGAGAGRVARFHHIPFLEIRGVTDAADGRARDDFRMNLPAAMENCAEVLLRLFP